ncbi:MAG: TonB-dependent receptor, partial [Cyclobacteriaceae bacterium]
MTCFSATSILARQSTSQVSGKILLDDNSPAISSHIQLVNTDYKTVANIDGLFHFSEVINGSYEMVVSFIGYEQKTIPITVVSNMILEPIRLSQATSELKDVLITANSIAQDQRERPISIESISMKNVVGRIADLTQAIDQVSGVRIRTSGALGDRVDISINGLNGSAVRTYVDGLPIEFVYPNLALNNIPFSNVGRLDVYKGVVPADVGSDALGGAINVVSDYKNRNELMASYSVGSFNTHIGQLNMNLAVKKDLILNLNSSFSYSDNNYQMNAPIIEWDESGLNLLDKGFQKVRRFHDQYRLGFVEGSLIFQNRKWADRFKIGVNYIDFLKNVQNGIFIENTAFNDVQFTGDNLNLIWAYEKSFGKFLVQTNFIYSDNRTYTDDATTNVYNWKGNVIATRNEAFAEFNNTNGPLDSRRDTKGSINRSTVTYDLTESDQLLISNLYAKQTATGRNELEPLADNDFLTKPQTLGKNVLGVQYKKILLNKRLTLLAGGKMYAFFLDGVNDNQQFTRFTKSDQYYGYYASAKHIFTDNLFVRSSYERTYRIPTFFQFFGDGNGIAPNEALRPEFSNNLNLGISYSYNTLPDYRFGIEVNGFLRNQNDLIFLDPSNPVPRNINADEVASYGLEGEFSASYKNRLKFSANITRFSKRFVTAGTGFSGDISGQEGKDFPNTPTFFTDARLSYTIEDVLKKDSHLD